MQCNAALSRVENVKWLEAAQAYLAEFVSPIPLFPGLRNT